MGGQIIDALDCGGTQTAQQREENARIKAGETPAGWEDKPAKRRQKDVEARWTKKHGKSHYGYKNHVNVDRRHKPGAALSCERRGGARQPSPRRYPGWGQHGFGCVADSAYRSAEIEAALKGEGVAEPDPSQGPPQQAAERAREARQQDPFVVRVRVEHVFGAQSNDMGGTLVRSVGCAGEGADRVEEPRLQHAPPGPTGASRGGRVTILGEGDRLGTVLWRK